MKKRRNVRENRIEGEKGENRNEWRNLSGGGEEDMSKIRQKDNE